LRPDPPIAGGGPGLATSTTALTGADDRIPHTTKSCGFSPWRVPVIHIRKENEAMPDAVDYTSPIADI